jgi:drug/metabolite transporter (DMT)-like permease
MKQPLSGTQSFATVVSFDSLVGAALVLFWSSGFVVPRFFAPYVEPVTFVAARNVGATVVLAAVAVLCSRPWPTATGDRLGLMWAGALFQGVYLMAVYWAIFHGLPVAIGALIGSLQPALTALFAARMLGERLSARQIAGMGVGLVGVALVLSPKFSSADAGMTIGLALIALAGVAAGAYGSVYQKQFEQTGDAWTRTALIMLGALIPPTLAAPMLERVSVVWAAELVAVYLWAVIALSIGGTMALLHLIRKGQAARAAALLYLMPPVSALMAYLAFGERIWLVQVAGFLVAAAGVYLVQTQGVAPRRA